MLDHPPRQGHPSDLRPAPGGESTPAPGGESAPLAAVSLQGLSLWVGSLASLAMIIGGISRWATAFGFMSVSGTRMHGGREVALGVIALAMLGVHGLRRGRLALIVAAAAGVLGAIGAIATLQKIDSDGAITVLGVQYQYLHPAWGLYLVLIGAIGLASAAALAWHASRPTRR